jgi:hypothetical protein
MVTQDFTPNEVTERKANHMSSRAGSWIVALGTLVLLLGLLVLGVSLGKSGDPDELPAGAGLFSLGALTLAGGLYLKAKALQGASPVPEAPRKESPTPAKNRGGCELCGLEAPVVKCKTHQIQLCGGCLHQHYDIRSCLYVPGARTGTGKPGKALAAKARGA